MESNGILNSHPKPVQRVRPSRLRSSAVQWRGNQVALLRKGQQKRSSNNNRTAYNMSMLLPECGLNIILYRTYILILIVRLIVYHCAMWSVNRMNPHQGGGAPLNILILLLSVDSDCSLGWVVLPFTLCLVALNSSTSKPSNDFFFCCWASIHISISFVSLVITIILLSIHCSTRRRHQLQEERWHWRRCVRLICTHILFLLLLGFCWCLLAHNPHHHATIIISCWLHWHRSGAAVQKREVR